MRTFVVLNTHIATNGNQFCKVREQLADGSWSRSMSLFVEVPKGQMYKAPVGLALHIRGRVAEVVRPAEAMGHLPTVYFAGGVEISAGEPAPGGTTLVARADEGLLAAAEGVPESLAD